MASSDLQWQILRKGCAFTRKQRGIKKTFSRDPLNLKNVHSIRYTGLVHKKAIGIHASPDGKGVILSFKKQKLQNRPNKAVERVTLASDSRKVMTTVGKITKGYKPAFKKLAMRRASRILQSQKTIVPRKTRAPRKKKTQ